MQIFLHKICIFICRSFRTFTVTFSAKYFAFLCMTFCTYWTKLNETIFDIAREHAVNYAKISADGETHVFCTKMIRLHRFLHIFMHKMLQNSMQYFLHKISNFCIVDYRFFFRIFCCEINHACIFFCKKTQRKFSSKKVGKTQRNQGYCPTIDCRLSQLL